MRNLYGVLSISLLACVAVNSAYGALASKGYVDSWKVDMLQGVEKANRALVTNQFGKVIVGQITKDMIADGAVTSGKIADGVIPTVGNGTITIKQTGKSDQTFTVNQGGNTTITLSDNDTKYTLPTASGTTKGGVKIGANVNVASDGTISVAAPKTKVSELTNDAGYLTAATLPKVDNASAADTATKATQDASGNVITETYATKTELTNKIDALDSSVTGATGKVITSVTQTDGKLTGTMDYIKVPVGSATAPTSMANIWIE